MNGRAKPFAAVLLAGGRSRRMGRDKALLTLADGQMLWRRQLSVLEALEPAELFVSGPERAGFPVSIIRLEDEEPGLGPLAGISAALAAMRSRRLVVLAVDLPAMTPHFLRALIAEGEEEETGTIPRHAGTGFYEPLAAVYPRSIASLASEHLASRDRSLQSFIRAAGNSVRAHDITPAERAFFVNWNEPTALSADPDQRVT